MIFFLIGFMGAGKSSMGKYAARRNELEFVDLDAWIEGQTNMTISQIFEERGEVAFRKLERKALESVIEAHQEKGLLLSCGGGTPCFFDNMDFMNASGTTFYLKLSPGMLANRLENAKTTRPLLKEVEELEPYIRTKLKERESFYEKAHHVVMGKMLSRNAFARWLGELLEKV